MKFSATKRQFHVPANTIYLDGNSLGPLPIAAKTAVQHTVSQEWGELLITGWNKAGWMAKPTELGDRIGKLIGAAPGTVVLGDTLSIKVYQALASALNINKERKTILSDTGNFPTDLYMAEGLIKSLDKGHVLKCVDPSAVADAIDEDVAVLMLTQVDYRTGRLHNMDELTKLAHQAGAVVIWDLAHSAGAFPVDLAKSNADFAVGCTYKYLNGGPGAPAFIYVHPKHIDTLEPALSGWLGHQAPFAFDLRYAPGSGIERLRVGTPPVLQMAALEAAMDIWDGVDLREVRQKSIDLSELFIDLVLDGCPQLRLASPRDPNQRGSQVSFHFHEGYAAMQALISQGVIGDFRAPDIMRFGITPLYLDENDIREAASILINIIASDAWDKPEFKTKSRVT